MALTMQRTVGIESKWAGCARCGAAVGGSVHALFCHGRHIAGEGTKLHNGLERELSARITASTGLKPAAETTEPFVGIADNRRMDLVCAPDSFQATALTNPVFGKSLMIDLSTVTVRSGKHRDLASHNVAECLRQVEAKKQDHYSGTFNPNSHVLKTFAVSTFGALGVEAKQVIEAMVTEEVARSGFVADGVIMADAQSWLKSSIVARIRGRLSIKLHAGISARVLKYLTAPTEDAGGVEVQVADQPGDHAD